MIQVNLLESFVATKTKPPIIMPENAGARKKGQAYIVLAPSIEDEFKYLADVDIIRFRYLTKYFIPKHWDVTLYGSGRKKIQLNADGEIDSLLERYRRGQLSSIDGVTSFLRPMGTVVPPDVLKNYNVLVEVNYIFEHILNSTTDKRLMSKKVVDLRRHLHDAMDVSYLSGKSTTKYIPTVIIPTNLWFTPAELRAPAQTIRLVSTNPMGVLLYSLCDPEVLKTYPRIILVDGPIVLILNPADIGEKTANDIRDCIINFMKMSKNFREKRVATTSDNPDEDVDEEDAIDDPKMTKVIEAEKQTVVDVTADRIVENLKADPDQVSPETMEKVKDVVRKDMSKKKIAKDTPPDEVDFTDQVPYTVADIPVDNSDMDVILAAQMEGRSVASQKRNEMLKEKYKDLKIGSTALGDVIHEEKRLEIPDVPVKAHTINPAMSHIKAQRFEETYEKTLATQDLVSILMHFSTARPAMYLNKDIVIDDISTSTDRMLLYTVEFEDENRKRHRFKFRMPKMYKNKYLYLNGQELNITHQKLPFPITKVRPERCQLVTNYNKIFVFRTGAALSPRVVKLKKLLSSGSLKGISIRKGDCTVLNKNAMTTVEFDELGSSFVQIMIGPMTDNITFYFDTTGAINAVVNTKAIPTIKNDDGTVDTTLFPVAVRQKKGSKETYWISGTTNQVYDDSGASMGELSDFLVQSLIKFNPAIEKEFADTSAGSKFMYTAARVMKKDIPLIVLMSAADPGGLLAVLEKGKIEYKFLEKRPTVDKNVTGVVPFADGYLVFNRYPYENSLLLNGLSQIPTKEYNFYDMNTRDVYVDIFDLMCSQKTLADNLGSFYYMMVDPITKEVLERLNMPTDFTQLLHYCNGVLADNSFQIDSNYENSRLRSNEIIYAYLYRELAIAWSNVRSGRTDTFSIPEDAVIKLLLTSNIIDPKSKLNITLELENDRNVKLKGPSGMNEERSFTIEKRAYHPSMQGIVAMNSTPSGEVGINRHMVLNPNLTDARGFIKVNQKDYDGTQMISPGEALQAFGPESSDIERLCMAISQSKHLVPAASQCSCPVSYDMERVAPYLSNDFAFQAKQAGKVVEITEDLMIVQYADGTFDDVDLSKHPAKNTDGGFYIMNQMETNLKVGSKFASGDIIASDKKYINNKDFFGDPCANVGTMARVMLEANGSVYEDSGYITDSFAHRFGTKITKQKRVILSKYANIKYIVKKGQEIQSNDPLLMFDDTEDEFSSQLLASITAEMEDQDEVVGTSAPVISKYSGVISDIDITYTIPLESMTPSLRKIVEEYSKSARKREKALGKYIDTRDANTIVKSSEMTVTDQMGKVMGVSIGDGVMIDFYIEYVDIAGNGDKGSASTCGGRKLSN